MGPAPLRRRSLTPRWPVALADAPRAPYWLARFIGAIGEWLFLVWLLAVGWQANPDPRTTGVLLAAWLVTRPAAPYLTDRLGPLLSGRWPAAALLAAQAATALAAAAFAGARFERLLLAALVFGALTAIAGAARGALLRRLFGGAAISAAGAFDTLIARLAFVAGPLLAVPLVLLAPPLAAWLAGVALLAAALVLVGLVGWERRTVPLRAPFAADDDAPTVSSAALFAAPAPPAEVQATAADATDGTTRPAFLPLLQPSAVTYLAGALAAGGLTGSLLASLPHLVTVRGGFDPGFVGAALALAGLGGLTLRVPALRLRARLPAALMVAALVWALALTVALIGGLGGLVVGVPLLVVAGGLAASLDTELLVGLRRAGDAAPSLLRWLLAAFALGQLGGALKIGVLGLEPQLLGGPLVTIALAWSALMAVALLYDRHSLFALRHQVQQFSWSADPPPRPFESPPPKTRDSRLADWIHRQVETELVDVTLPISRRHYAIARPSGDGRDSLFEQAKVDPERQMPYWAKVWPSGVALADLVAEQPDNVRDQQVLELGAGLGVTAATVLEEGGRLVTADYSLLPLALCRLNGLVNAGRAPGSICFNWRDEEQVRDVLRRHPPIGLILAADVLYEVRDVMPLVNVVERLLAPDGALWLAEPVRRTAQRFVDHVAALGWQVDSRRIQASWPDASSGWVNVHIIRRETAPADAAVGLGGWQL